MKIQKFMLTLLAVAILYMIDINLALAAEPWENAALKIKDQLLSIASPLAIIVIMVTGFLAWRGRVQWATVGSVVVGFVFVFGATQISTFLQQALS
jgi:type IV secretory pathway VirB2 component (pilin)